MLPDDQKPRWFSNRNLVLVAVIVCIAGIGVTVPQLRLAMNASLYRSHGGKEHFLFVYQSLRNGDRLERVQELLGPGVPNHDPRYWRLCEKVYAAQPADAPSGILATDLLLGYKAQGAGIHLQFRDGELINHDPTAKPFMESFLSR